MAVGNAISAFQYCFPGIIIIGCRFYYGQCVFNKIVEIGLKKDYSDDEDLRIVVQNCIALALCYHKNSVDSEIIDIYCDHVCGKSEPDLWNYWNHMETRTNNRKI